MLFEDALRKEEWGKSIWLLALITVIYASVSMLIANNIFGANAGIVGIAFLTIFLLPVIQNIRDVVERPTSIKDVFLGKESTPRSYFVIFMTVFLVYTMFSFLLPLLGFDVTNVFKEQLQSFLPVGSAVALSTDALAHILEANLFVLTLAFLFGFIWVDSGIFFVLWNASAWGATFGFRSVAAAAAAGANPWEYLGLLFIQVIWHAVIEGGAYVLAAAAGGMIGHAAYQHKENPYLYGGAVLAGTVVVVTLHAALPTISLFLNLAFLAIVVFFISVSVPEENLPEVIRGSKWFGYSVIIFLIGAIVEAVVLSNSESVNMIYAYADMFIRS